MSRHFCCCIPVRVAVFITSFFAFLFSAAIAGLAFFVLIKSKDDSATLVNLTSQQKIGFGIGGGLYALIALVSLFGFIGSIIRKRSFVALYSSMTFIFFFLQAAVSGYLIFALYHSNGIVKCSATDANGTSGSCEDLPKGTKIAVIVSLIIQLLIQLYIIVVIRRYVKQLDEEQAYHRTSGHVDSAFKMGPTNAYYPHQPLEQGQGLLAPKGHYPYSDPHNSFGTPGHHHA